MRDIRKQLDRQIKNATQDRVGYVLISMELAEQLRTAIRSAPAVEALYTDEEVREAYACIRTHNRTIPDECLDQMRDVLLAALAARPAQQQASKETSEVQTLKRVLALLDKCIQPGALPDNGTDKLAERNGLILAYNLLQHEYSRALRTEGIDG